MKVNVQKLFDLTFWWSGVIYFIPVSVFFPFFVQRRLADVGREEDGPAVAKEALANNAPHLLTIEKDESQTYHDEGSGSGDYAYYYSASGDEGEGQQKDREITVEVMETTTAASSITHSTHSDGVRQHGQQEDRNQGRTSDTARSFFPKLTEVEEYIENEHGRKLATIDLYFSFLEVRCLPSD